MYICMYVLVLLCTRSYILLCTSRSARLRQVVCIFAGGQSLVAIMTVSLNLIVGQQPIETPNNRKSLG